MFKVLSERQMRRRMGKSARQWKRLKKAERRGTPLTQAKRQRLARRNLERLERAWRAIG